MQSLRQAIESTSFSPTSLPPHQPAPSRQSDGKLNYGPRTVAHSDCPNCLGQGFVYYDLRPGEPGFGQTVYCPKCTDWLTLSRLTAEEQAHTIDEIADRDDDPRGEMLALRFMGKEMLRDPYGFLSIYGKRGAAKSLLLTALIAEFCRRGRQAIYFNAAEIVSMLSPGDDAPIDGFRYSPGNPESSKRKLIDIPVLAIDEIDKIRWSAWHIQHIGEIIEWRHRHADRLVTLFSMNKPPWSWQNAEQTEHIASRLRDGRFNRRWPEDKAKWLPACAVDGEIAGLFQVTLPDIRPTLRRTAQ